MLHYTKGAPGVPGVLAPFDYWLDVSQTPPVIACNWCEHVVRKISHGATIGDIVRAAADDEHECKR